MFGYLAFEGFEKELLEEIQFNKIKEVTQKGRLFLLKEDVDLIWAQLKLNDLQVLPIKSINDAATQLKKKKKTWAHYADRLHRRSELIQENTFRIKKTKYKFQQEIPKQDFGFWTLNTENEILYSESTQSPLPLAKIEFEEDKISPPSRAYLKLWETFTVHLDPPKKNEKVLDMGSCPGGWTWVLQSLGCKVVSVDKAPLDEKIQKLPNIEFIKKDAFKLKPQSISKPDWFFSDIICEPHRLLEMVKLWMQAYPNLKFVCTIKYKGKTDFKTTEEFLKIPGSRIIHLNHNKHEVTWMKVS